jgi:RecA-family ATPase
MSRALSVSPAYRLAQKAPEDRWLVEGLWADEAVGIVGGEPKCCKSFLALDLAVAVASGRPCLRRVPVRKRGRVLLYAAEDSHCVVRARLEGICHAAGVILEELDVLVITEPTLRLDLGHETQRLAATVEQYEPVLLVLDPFVRMHRIDENVSGEVAPILSSLRSLQQRHHTAVVLVHHARKGGSKRPGQGLRGSSEFHAWGDSNLYLQRQGEKLRLTTEHRAAAAIPPMNLNLEAAGSALALAVVADETAHRQAKPQSHAEKIVATLCEIAAPMTIDEIRAGAKLRKATVCEELGHLVEAGRVHRRNGSYTSA